MKRAAATVCILLLTSCEKKAAMAPKEASRAFYAAVLPLMGHGVPGDIQPLLPHISHELANLLIQASEAEDAYYKRTGSEVPPMVEGDLFSSLSEGATSFKVVSAWSDGRTWKCQVDLTYYEPGNTEPPYIWSDRTTLIQESGHWVVDDLDLLSKGETVTSGTLKNGLRQIIKNGNDPAFK